MSEVKTLTPFFSRRLSDATYWQNIDTTHITQLTDGWAHVACDNSAGTSAEFINAFVAPQPFVVGGKTYTTLVEVRNTTGVGVLNALSSYVDTTQLTGVSKCVSPIKDGTYYFPQQTPNANLINASTLTSRAQSTSMTNCLHVARGNDAALTWSYDGCHVVVANTVDLIGSLVAQFNLASLGVAVGDTITFSADVKGNVGTSTPRNYIGIIATGTTSNWWVPTSDGDKHTLIADSPDWVRYSVSMTITSPSTTQVSLQAQGANGASTSEAISIITRNWKLEKSYAATAYAPAADELSSFTGGLNRSYASIAAGETVSFDLRLSLYEGNYNGPYGGLSWVDLAGETWAAVAAGDTPPHASDTWAQHAGVTWESIGTKRWVELSHGAETGDEYAAYVQYDYQDL